MNSGDRTVRIKKGSRLLFTKLLTAYERYTFDKGRRTLYRVFERNGMLAQEEVVSMDDYPPGSILLVIERLA